MVLATTVRQQLVEQSADGADNEGVIYQVEGP